MASRRIVYALILCGLSAFWLFYDGRVSVFLFVPALALPFVSLLISLPFLKRPAVYAEVPPSVARGGEVTLAFSIRSRRNQGLPCPLPGSLRVAVRDLMDGTTAKYVFPTPGDARILFKASHSGVWQIETVRASVTDFLGLWSFRAALPSPSRLTVNPIPAEPSPSPEIDNLLAASYRPKPGGGFSEFHELREYRPGDPVRTLHWKASAKTDKPVVREAEEAVRSRALIVFAPSFDRADADAALDAAVWVSGELLRREIPHEIFAQKTGALVPIRVEEDLAAFVGSFLSSPLAGPEAENYPEPGAEWVFRAGSDARPAEIGRKGAGS